MPKSDPSSPPPLALVGTAPPAGPDDDSPAAPTTPKRTRGRPFEKGNCANPGGRPRSAPALRKRLLELGPLAVRTLEETMRNSRAASNTRVKAAIEVIAYALGRPTTTITGADGAPLIPGGPTGDDDPFARLLALLQKPAPEPGPEDPPGPGNASPGANGEAGEGSAA